MDYENDPWYKDAEKRAKKEVTVIVGCAMSIIGLLILFAYLIR